MKPLARQLAQLSALEMVAALGAGWAPAPLKRGLALPFFAASRQLGETLAELDDSIAEHGLPVAASAALRRFGVQTSSTGAGLARGPCLVLANHPGAYDALALMAAIDRADLLILAADRAFLRALPRLSQHLVFVGARPFERAGALRRALLHLRRGGALLHFPAGEIEPDAAFSSAKAELLLPWQPGLGALLAACAKSAGRVLLAGVRGVHSARAKRLLLNRLAERRGITTLAPLLQMVLGWRDVETHVALCEAESPSALVRLNREQQSLRLRAALLSALST